MTSFYKSNLGRKAGGVYLDLPRRTLWGKEMSPLKETLDACSDSFKLVRGGTDLLVFVAVSVSEKFEG